MWSIANLSGYGLPAAPLGVIIKGILFWLLMMFGVIAVIGFIISGIMYITAFGDEKLMERGKKGMQYSIIGVIVGLCGLVVIQAVFSILSGWMIF